MSFRLPQRDQRIAVVGHTGSGKTLMAAWLLSHASIDRRPWLVVDYKRDSFLNKLENIRKIGIKSAAPRKAGLHLLQPNPRDEGEGVEDMLWRVWEKGNAGVYIDEAHMLPRSAALQALLTQGRSKKIPMIILVQRPVWTSRFVFSEADYLSAFHIQYPDDRKFLSGLMDTDLRERLPEYHSRWHDVASATTYRLTPVPHPNILHDRISSMLRPNTFWL